MNTDIEHGEQRQQGAVLIVSLIMLLLLTIIGVTGMQVTNLEEKMAGNTRDINLAFQAAEAALRDGEEYAEDSFSADDAGVYEMNDGAVPNFFSATWDNSNSRLYSQAASFGGVNTDPRFLIEYQRISSGEIDNYGDQALGGAFRFRVTARGTGSTDNSRIWLQSYYLK